jgi:hypothetical protein
MNMGRGKRRLAEAERADGVGGGTLSRRKVLGGLAVLPAVPVLYCVESASPAAAASVLHTTTTRPGRATKGTDDPVRGVERRYNAPLLTPGTRLVLPAGIQSVPIKDYYRHPHLASAKSAWPHMTATDGTTVEASIVPERGAPTRIAMLSGFTEGWYELIHTSGRADRVIWDARKLPFLWFYGEFGATSEAPYRNRLYTLALQPFSRNPYSRRTLVA